MNKESEVFTFGCRLNIYESEIIMQDLKENAVTNTSVFNSCAVTSESVKQIKREIRKKSNILYTICICTNYEDIK